MATADFEAVSTSIKQMEHRMEQIAALKAHLLRILEAINQSFPDMQYITSYARADSITRKSPAELKALRQAGLNRSGIKSRNGYGRF